MICEYGCGGEAKYFFKCVKKWCCESHWAKCPQKRKEISKKSTECKKPKKIITKELCSYGCGQIAKYQYKNGKWCCSKNWEKCPAVCKKTSERMKGKNNPMFGKQFSESHRQKLSNTRQGPNHPRFGKKLSEKQKIKIGNASRHSLKRLENRYPVFFRIEDLREHPITKKIQVRCKNHNCKNSKEQNGWFTPTYIQLYERIRAIERQSGFEENNFYCCNQCKKECPLYKSKNRILTNIIKPNYYTTEEYNIWRQEVLIRADNKCEYCGEKATHCHHIKPQKLEPFFSLDPDFGLACCKKCHYEKGHNDECSTGQLAQKICL